MIARLYLALAAALVLVGLGCAAHLGPWVEEYVFDRPATLLGDAPPDAEVLVVGNPTGGPAIVTVECGSAERVRWSVEVPARGKVRGFAQLIARDVGASTCEVIK